LFPLSLYILTPKNLTMTRKGFIRRKKPKNN
jgi:hypothetical protein